MQDKLTIQDIARLAGVSKATVSRVLNHHPSVSRGAYERVMRIVQEHRFVPNAAATGLAGGRPNMIGVLTPPMTWPAVPEMLRGVAEYIEDTPYEVVLYSIRFERNHSDVLDRILSMPMISGLIAILPGEIFPLLQKRFQQGFPLVVIDDQEQPAAIPWIGIDNFAAAYEVTRHLLDLGHRRIAYFRGPQHYYCVLERTRGYAQALRDAGLVFDPALVFQGSFDLPSGHTCARILFARERSTWPTAIFASNDQMAYGILDVAEQMGIRIPEDVALAGFDDNMLSAHMRPPLTTIHQPFFEMGWKAIETLLMEVDPEHRIVLTPQRESLSERPLALSETALEKTPRIELPTSLIVRASSGIPLTPYYIST